jgi:serine/threonine protein kinase
MNDARPSNFRLSSPHRDCDTGEWTARSRSVGSFEAIDDLDSRSVVIPNPFGRYAIDRLLGQGSMGAVFLAYDEYLQRQVALKIPLFRGDAAGPWKVRFLREARAAANLRHPNICPVFDAGEAQGILYLTMAYIEGSPLSALMLRGPRNQEEAVELVRTLARAMLVAHATGTLHRDLKPANILIDSNSQPVIMDFGLARRAKWSDEAATSDEPATSDLPRDLGVTQFGSLLGTLPYMPPEQARGDLAALGPWSDVYSLGVILYELLTDRLPFTGEAVVDLVRRIEYESPPRPAAFYPWLEGPLEAVCLKALAKNPSDRYQTMGEFERALPEAVEVHAQ